MSIINYINDINEIVPHLYLSNWYTSNNIDVLQKYKIKAVITLETNPKPSHILAYYQKYNIDNMYITIPDIPDADIMQYFDETYNFINKHIMKGENVLVHCMAGISRSSTIVLNYIIKKMYENNKVTTCPCKLVHEIIEFARIKRPVVNPNEGFIKQLLLAAMEYQKIWRQNYDKQYNTTFASVK
jgi:protein-tyrosine phosphatase